jgi:hypothetical protein
MANASNRAKTEKTFTKIILISKLLSHTEDFYVI